MVEYGGLYKNIKEAFIRNDYVAVDKVTDPNTFSRILKYQGYSNINDFASRINDTNFFDTRGHWMIDGSDQPEGNIIVEEVNVLAAYIYRRKVIKIKTILYQDETGNNFMKTDVLG